MTVTVLLAAAAAAVHRFSLSGQLDPEKWAVFGQPAVLGYLLQALGVTLIVTAVSAVLALPLGVALALARLSRSRLLRLPATGWVEALRAVPLLLLVYAFLLGLPAAGLHVPLFWQLVCPIVLTNSAVLAEIFRAGVQGIPRGQTEAGYALGLGYWATLRLVVLPQAVRHSSPALVGQLVRLLKDSTLGYVVSVLELLNAAKVLGEFNHSIVQAYLVVAAVFVAVNGLLAVLASRLERRVGGGPRPGSS
ncbi:amino acid ABC transporter permease [Streptomyces sp. NPDC056632]|uniref:amino acid ABC transporter permease n=1 Tax=Streptomyces sp. NPDC056632 TaxID=3345884 RepID=UPI00369E92C0